MVEDQWPCFEIMRSGILLLAAADAPPDLSECKEYLFGLAILDIFSVNVVRIVE